MSKSVIYNCDRCGKKIDQPCISGTENYMFGPMCVHASACSHDLCAMCKDELKALMTRTMDAYWNKKEAR